MNTSSGRLILCPQKTIYYLFLLLYIIYFSVRQNSYETKCVYSLAQYKVLHNVRLVKTFFEVCLFL